MNRLFRFTEGRTVWLAAFIVAAAAAVAAGIAAGPASAAPAANAGKASYPFGRAAFARPTLVHGVLAVKGTKGSDKITLRLSGKPETPASFRSTSVTTARPTSASSGARS